MDLFLRVKNLRFRPCTPNTFFAKLADLKSRDDSNLLDNGLLVSMGELVTKVQTLFGDDIAAHFNSTTSSLTAIRRPDAYFIFEAKKLRDETLFKMYQTALKGTAFPAKITPGYPTLSESRSQP